MSIKLMNLAWEMEISPVAKIILLKLADNANDSGVCWPSVSLLASSCGVSTRTVQRHLHEFVEDKIIIVTKRTRSNGSQASNQYKLSLGGVTECQGEGVTSVAPRTTIYNNKKKGTISPDFRPDENSMNWLRNTLPEKIMDVETETEKFINYFIDTGTKRTGWQRSWMNWMRNARKTKNVTNFLASRRSPATNEEIIERITGQQSVLNQAERKN